MRLSFYGASEQLRKTIVSYVTRLAELASAVLRKARDKLADVKVAMESARQKVSSWKNDINNYQSSLKVKSQALEEEKKRYATDCNKECPHGL